MFLIVGTVHLWHHNESFSSLYKSAKKIYEKNNLYGVSTGMKNQIRPDGLNPS